MSRSDLRACASRLSTARSSSLSRTSAWCRAPAIASAWRSTSRSARSSSSSPATRSRGVDLRGLELQQIDPLHAKLIVAAQALQPVGRLAVGLVGAARRTRRAPRPGRRRTGRAMPAGVPATGCRVRRAARRCGSDAGSRRRADAASPGGHSRTRGSGPPWSPRGAPGAPPLPQARRLLRAAGANRRPEGSKTPLITSVSAPVRIVSELARPPASRDSEPVIRDLPAPVSPVTTFRPGPNWSSARSITARFRTYSERSTMEPVLLVGNEFGRARGRLDDRLDQRHAEASLLSRRMPSTVQPAGVVTSSLSSAG